MSLRSVCLLGLILLLFSDCSRLPFSDLAVIGRNFDNEVQQTQNLTFTFNKDVGPDKPTGAWDSTQYIRFTPAVRGKFRWTSPSELVFSPAVAFAPATDYRAELTDDLLRRLPERSLHLSGDVLSFHTPYLQLEHTESWWTRNPATGQPVAKTQLTLNYPVPTAEVMSRLTLKAGERGDQALTAQPGTSSDPNTIALTLANTPSSQQEIPLTIRIDKGISLPNTAYISQQPIEQTTTLPTRAVLAVTDIQARFDANEGVVRVVTTQELRPDDLATSYTIQPQLPTTAELTENGFVIRGNFTESDTYVLTLNTRLQGVLGANLKEPVSRDLFFGKMPASIRFANPKAVYLSSKGVHNVGLDIVNVPSVQVRIAKVFENNILTYLRTNRYEQYAEQADGGWAPSGAYSYNSDETGDLSAILVDKTVETLNLPRVRGVSALNIAMPDRNKAFRGVYVVTVGSRDEAYLQATQLVALSDIGLIVRQTPDEVLVWANALQTAEPMQGVDITLVSKTNQSLMTAKTDGSGLARFAQVREKAPGFTVALVTARTDDDFTFLSLADTQVETSRFPVEGKRDNPTGFDAFVYGDRDIYRPGETVHLNTVVRGLHTAADKRNLPADIPLLVRVLAPNGRELQVARKVTNAQGAVATDIPLPPTAVTGTYTVEVLNGNDVLLTARSISVEEFIPDRISLETLTDRSRYQAGQTITLSATARNLFGPPAADRTYEMELRLNRKTIAPSGFETYSFAMAGADDTPVAAFPKELRQGRTNANGQATERFVLPARYQDMGLLDGKLFVTVFDENGRPVNRLRRFDVLTQSTFFGTRLPDRYVTTQTPIQADFVALTADGVLSPSAQARVDIVRFDYQTVIEKKDEQIRYTTQTRETSVYTNTLTFANGRGTVRYVPVASGDYEIRIRRPGATHYAATRFYAYGYGSTTASSFDVSQEGQVLMTLDKERYTTGDKARVLIKAPFDGRLLLTVERNRVLEHHWLTTANRAAEWTFPVGAEQLPNVYVTATLIRAIDDTQLPLTVAHGFAVVPVQQADTQLPVAITAPALSRSKTRQTIRVKTAPNAQLTVAVVDEGILQIKNFKTPDPHGFFYQKRALEVNSHDLYTLLYPELSLRATSSVGGDGYDLERRINPLSNGRVNLVAFWSGPLTADGSGNASVTVDIPAFSGDLRVMAVAYKDNAFGSANSSLKVADPIVISTGVPRFLSPGDQFELPVNLTNTTAKAARVTAQLSLTGPLQADSVRPQTLLLPPGRESRVVFRIGARQAIGPGSITISVAGTGETFTDKTDVTVRPAASLQKQTLAGSVQPGTSLPLRLPGAFLPGTARATITLSRTPATQYGRPLSYLLGYPHGCLEQTVSRAFPQLYVADLARQLAPATQFVRAGDNDLNPTTNIRRAIQAVESLQTADGGFMLWPPTAGQVNDDPWASAYAVHFLTEAQEAGFAVRPATLGHALDYLTTLTNRPTLENTTVYDETGGQTVRKVASRTNLYALYVLTKAGKPNRSAMNYYKQHGTLLTSDSRYVLAAAFRQLGDNRSAQALLPRRYTDFTTSRETGGSYASPLRNLALALDVLADTDPGNAQIPLLARQLTSALGATQTLNTQEASFAFLALGKLSRQHAGSTATATLTAGAKALGKLTGSAVTLRRIPINQPLVLTASGNAPVYYFADYEGVPTRGSVTEADNGLRIRRTLLDRSGNPVRELRQNDLVVVRLSVASLAGATIDNVVLTDLLPAGLEVENSRLTEGRDMPWLPKGEARLLPDHVDLRDDRINVYSSVSGREQSFYYLARAVSKGRFVQGPVSADAMYDPALRSYSGSGILVIR
ncbi:alpha-2-macroglobulin family protein [Spirosoma luteolum]